VALHAACAHGIHAKAMSLHSFLAQDEMNPTNFMNKAELNQSAATGMKQTLLTRHSVQTLVMLYTRAFSAETLLA